MLMDTIKQLDSAGPTTNVSGDTVGGSVYDIAGSTLSQPTGAAVLMRFSVTHAFSFAASMAGSFAESEVAATGSPVYILKKNGTQFATLTFSGNAGTFGDMAATVSFVQGDILTLVAPATADATHDEIAWTLAGTLV